ncbi:MAG: response regulator [Bryobacteraceae bacterium]
MLLVDGHRAGLRARCMVLEEEGHVATGVSSPDEALQLLTEEKFGVIVTEFKLIGTTGPEFIAKLRQVAPGTPVLLLSGYVDALGLSERSTGADAVLMKSASEPNQLTYTVSRLLRMKPAAARAKKPAASDHTAPRRVIRPTGTGR